ncbi:MAG TPA: M20/M25/M40 family metallo-hydrolase [Vicinamibacterales bacterium]|jgi:acetylornithine deacetylase/succinyl-diaminopimelate desuccinylase-like protein|nr:M20/M25/M40 family metallo-hydrolase [Vicinamibacterales bacterium]
MRHVWTALVTIGLSVTASAQTPDWKAVEAEALQTLQRYVRINTSNPPGDVTRAADFVAGLLEKEGIPVTRYESVPGRSIVLGRLKGAGHAKPLLLLHHMDVVPADASRWTHDPFGAEIADGRLWGRGSIDMKGPGVIQLYSFILLKRLNIPLDRDVLLMAVPDEEVGGGNGAVWMRKNHFADLDPEYVLDEGGVGSRDLFAPGKLVFGISVAEKKLLWLKLTAEGVAGHGSQPHDQNANDRLIRALAHLLAEPLPTASFSVLATLASRVGTLAPNKFNNAIQHSTISITSLRSGVGEPPRANVIPSVAEATIDCRVLPGTSKDEWLKEIARRLNDPAIKIEVTYESDDPVVTSQDSTFYKSLEAAVKKRYPDAIVTPMLVPFGTDSNGFRPMGVKSYGFTPVVVPAASVMSMHGDAEFVPVDALGPAIQILFDALIATVRSR